MRIHTIKDTLNATVRVAALFLFGAVATFGQQVVNLTAAPTTTTQPDGSTVPMWGYFCTPLTGTQTSTATCNALNPASVSTGTWSPVVISVPAGQYLTINLTNNLSFAAGTGTNTVPTSLVIVGQLGGGLGVLSQRTTTTSPDHSNAQPLTWPIAGDAPGAPPTGVGFPPTQNDRVQSFSTEVAAGATKALTFGSQTNPLRPGTYLIESGTHPSIQGPMGLYGMLVVTTAPAGTGTTATAGTAYPAVGATPAVNYNAEANLLFSEIDPVQNTAVQAAVITAGFTETAVWSGQPNHCGNPSSANYHTCYPPAVNYTPLYYMINGVAFDRTHASTSVFNATAGTDATTGLPVTTGITGTVLLRLVNAGLRMHVPSVVGSQTGTAVAPALPPAGFSLIAEDGNPLPGVPRVQSEVFMAAGKTYDVMVNAPATGASALPVYDRELSLSGNATARDAGMLAYIGINGSGLPTQDGSGVFAAATARADTYNSVVAGQPFTMSDPSKGVIANDTNVYGVHLLAAPTHGTVTLNADGTFTYTPTSFNPSTGDSFTYCANNAFVAAVGTTAASCSSPTLTATVTLGAGTLGGVHAYSRAYTAKTATSLSIKSPGVLGTQYDLSGNPAVSDTQNYPLSVVPVTAPTACTGSSGTYLLDAQGGFTVSLMTAGGSCGFSYTAKNSQGTLSAPATVTVTFPAPSNLQVKVLDGQDKTTEITDYRWIIEEDRTFYVDPKCTTNTTTPPAGCPSQTSTNGVPPTFGVNFHTSYMPLVAMGCTGTLSCEGGQTMVTPTGAHVNAVCDIGNGVCRPDLTGNGFTPVLPSSAVLDPTKRYYISVLPGDAANPFAAAYGGAPDCSPAGVAAGSCGHGMAGAPIPALSAGTTAYPTTPYTILTQPTPFPPAKLSVFVFEDDFPLNGEQDGGGGTGAVNTNNEPGLGGFEITLFDDAGGTGDATGQLTHDMFNQPLSNALAGTIDPLTGKDACPITAKPFVGADTSNGNAYGSVGTIGITGRIVTCPEYEADGVTPSPLAGQAVVPNMMQGRYGVVATPGADRIGRGEEWLQTNTLDGQKAHDSFLRIGEPSFFQEYGPAGWHVSIGFANPKIINSRLAGVCGGTDPTITGTNCNHTLQGMVTTSRMSRTPDERLYGSGSNDSFSFTQCYVSFGDPDGEDFAFTKCNADGTFSLSGLPDGSWRLTVFDQWNDMLVDGLSTPVGLGTSFAACPGNIPAGPNATPPGTCDMGQISTGQWQANIYTSTFFDQNGDGVRQDNEPGLTLVSTNIRFRDGSYSNFNNTDLNGNAGFNEVFPLFSWYVIETDSTRYKSTGTHVVYDAGGPADGTLSTCGGTVNGTGYPPCGNSAIGHFMANTAEPANVALPAPLRVPGAVYCSNADCSGFSIATGPVVGGSSGSTGSTGRIDPPWVLSEGWQGFSGQNSFLEFGKKPFAAGENGGIRGEVNYASTRPFDDPQLLLHVSWTPDVPNVTVNLYQEGFASDGVTPTLKLVDTTKTSSFDDWAQGFRSDSFPNMNCPGQSTSDLFYFSLYNQPDYLDVYNSQHSGTPLHAIPNNSQFKCYDGMHNWNQLQPAPYDGMYQFPSVTGINPTTGKPAGTNCTICVANPDTSDPYRSGLPMLPSGKYVVEVVVPPGYELVKEEDKNILIGDNYIAPVTQQFGALGSIFIIPDQASVASYNANNAQNPTTDLGSLHVPRGEGDTGSVEQYWPCVGEARIVPDFMSIFPQAQEVAAFAGATRNLCDRKEITLQDQMSALAKFYIFTSAHVAAHFTGVITDDYTSEFDPFSPQFGEKFSPPDLPVSIKDWSGNEISRVYADHWGTYDGLTYSSWEVNPPNPTGYGPTMMVVCMNDPGTGPTPDPLFNAQYSQFCYEIPFMPGQTQYMDTPVVPTSAFAGAGYNNVDCAYPDTTPAIAEVDSSDGLGPWVSKAGHTLTITALGDQMVPNNAYAGPQATTAPYNQKTIKRHYGFGSQNGVNGTHGAVTIGGVPATINSWSDQQIVVTVPATGSQNRNQVQPCAVQQQAQYGGSTAYCGELVISTSAALTGGNVTGVTITRGGSYNTAPTVTFGAAPAGGTTATGTANLGTSSGVASVAVTAGGTGYTTNPGVTFTGGGGTGAAGTAVRQREVTAVTISGTGGSYPGTGPVTVTFTGTTAGTTATGTVVLSATSPRHVTGVTITNPGSYSLTSGAINVTFSAPAAGGTRATGSVTTTNFVASVTVTAAGTGYSTAPTVGFTGGGGSGATASAALSSAHAVASVTIANPGSGYTTAPSVTFSAGATGGTSTATGTATIGGPSMVLSGKQSIDAVTVTIGGKTPTHVAPSASVQAAIDAAAPGDLIIVDPSFTPSATAPAGTSCATATAPSATCVETTAAHNELLIMWKPVRLQGVGAATSIINANTHPAGKLDVWRQQVVCLFGLGLNGSPLNTSPHTGDVNLIANTFDPTGAASCPGAGWNYFKPFDESGAAGNATNAQVDRLPLEATVGWDANLNGNLAELLQEPSLMGALEGAGITVLAKGVNFPSDPFDSTLLAGFPTGTTLLQNTSTNPNGDNCTDATGNEINPNPFPSNYSCNPSSIDALGITNSSQGGGGIFIHGWGHNLQVANNRIYNNAGTLSGGINVGQGEYPPAYVQGSITNAAPGSCEDSPVFNAVLPYCQNININIHNNYVSSNSSTGDELFSATPAGAGGVSICTGSDFYKFNYNWVCGNLTSGDGGGVGHIGFSFNGDIEHNTIIFNQSTNPTIPTNGGGLVIMGAPDADIICNNSTIDQDCTPFGAPGGNPGNTPVASVGPSDGVGPGLVINANLIMGNAAETGTGAGISFNAVNGSDMVAFPTDPGQWNLVTVTNNIIADNVGGWDGAGISLHDSPNVNIINNTIAYNSSTASAGILFNTLGAPLASQGGASCTSTATTTCPQPAGLVAIQHSAVLAANLPSGTSGVTVICPQGHFQTTATNGSCKTISYPKLENNVFWHNSSYYIGVGAFSPQFQQNVVSLYNAFTGSAVASQPKATSQSGTTSVTITGGTGACVSGTQYWDIGVRGDTGPANHGSGVTLNPTDSVLTSTAGYGGGNTASNPNFISQYCDGSRVAPETPGLAAAGWLVPPGISDATVPNPIFNLAPAATVDEGNNWVNMSWGPLTLTNPTVLGSDGNYGGGAALGNYAIAAGSSAIGRVPPSANTNYIDAPAYDFFDRPRKPGAVDAGAVQSGNRAIDGEFTLSPSSLDFGTVPAHSPTTLDQDVQVVNSDLTPVTFNPASFTISCANVTTGCNTASFSIQTSAIQAATVVNGGTGYALGDVLNLTGGGGSGATVTVTAVSATTAITALTVTTTGNGYANNATVTLVDTTGASTGTGATARITVFNPSTCIAGGTITLAQGEACVVNVVFNPTSTSQAARNATLSATSVAGATQTVSLTGHDSIATLRVSAITPALTANPANTAAVTGTITITNILNPCVAAPCPAGSSIDAGPWVPTVIRLSGAVGQGTFALGGTCAVGTAVNPGGTLVPPAAGSSCTVTITYTPLAGATGAALNGRIHLTVTGYGTASTAPVINANFNAN